MLFIMQALGKHRCLRYNVLAAENGNNTAKAEQVQYIPLMATGKMARTDILYPKPQTPKP